MSERKANLKGKIVGYAHDEMFAVVETKLGNALLDISDALDYRLKIGDSIEVEDAGFYIADGQIVTILGYKYVLNGMRHEISELNK
ncbi:MAG: hypothetical protein HZB10_00100 [Candidatus Yonathbacteria bacterium]|nr:hypothetical protein [Candidatus Yonathbacteria bacterium]